MMHLDIYTDGASRGNPGPATCAYLFVCDGEIVETYYTQLGKATNNQAEYQAIILALENAVKHKPDSVTLYSDSEIAIKQLNRVYKTKNQTLRDLRDAVSWCELDLHLKVIFKNTPRENPFIQQADKLCNLAFEGK